MSQKSPAVKRVEAWLQPIFECVQKIPASASTWYWYHYSDDKTLDLPLRLVAKRVEARDRNWLTFGLGVAGNGNVARFSLLTSRVGVFFDVVVQNEHT